MNKPNNFILFLLSVIFSKFGDSIDLIAFMWLTYTVTGSTVLTGIVAAFNGLPSLILGIFSGVVADRYDKKVIIVSGSIMRGIVVILVFVFYVLNLLNVYILIISTLIISTLEVLYTPARRSVLPLILAKEELLKGNSKLSTCKLLAQIIGLSVTGFVIIQFGLGTAVLLDAFMFIFSAVLVVRMEIPKTILKKAKISLRLVISDLKDTFRILLSETLVFKTTIWAMVINIFIGPFNLLILQYCRSVLQNDSQGQSILNTLNIIGIIMISFVFTRFSGKIKSIKMKNLIIFGFFVLSISYMLFGVNRWMFGAVFIAFLYGVGTGLVSVPSVTLIQQNMPKEHLGKVLSVISLTSESSIPVGNLLIGIWIARMDIRNIFIISGISMLLLVIFTHIIFQIYIKASTQ